MISSLFFAVSLFVELLRATLSAALFASIVKFNRIRYFTNAIGIILLATGLTTSTGLLINKKGQELTLIIVLLLLVNILRSIVASGKKCINRTIATIFALATFCILILPSFSFFLNSPELLEDYIFWLKRSSLVLFLILLGCFSYVGSIYSIRSIIVVVFFVNCLGVVASFFVPEVFIFLVDPDDPMLEKGLNPMGGGFFLNPNGAALSVVFSYLALVYVRTLLGGNLFVFLSFLFFSTLAITGSRGGFLCGLFILAYIVMDARIHKSFNISGFVIFIISLSLTVAILMNFFDGNYVGGFSRIVDLNNEGNLASNDSRWNALVSSINLAFLAPFIGSGFGLRNNLLDTQPHNMYVAYAIDVGIAGILIFPAFIVLLTGLIFKCQNKFNYRVTAFAILFMGLFDHEILYSKQFAYLIFIALALSRLYTIHAPQKFGAL